MYPLPVRIPSILPPNLSPSLAAVKSSNGVLGFFELFWKFYAVEEYSEVVKVFRRVYTRTYGRQKMIPWKFFFLAVRLELSFEDILIQWRRYQ